MTAPLVEKERMSSDTLKQAVQPPVAALQGVQVSRKVPDVALAPQTKALFKGLLAKDSINLARLTGPVAKLALASKVFGGLLNKL